MQGEQLWTELLGQNWMQAKASLRGTVCLSPCASPPPLKSATEICVDWFVSSSHLIQFEKKKGVCMCVKKSPSLTYISQSQMSLSGPAPFKFSWDFNLFNIYINIIAQLCYSAATHNLKIASLKVEVRNWMRELKQHLFTFAPSQCGLSYRAQTKHSQARISSRLS